MASANICLCAMCGLPASGKTTLCRLLSELATVKGSGGGCTGPGCAIAIVHVCYDTIIPRNLDQTIQVVASDYRTQKHSLWKEYRHQIVKCLDFIVGELTEKDRTLHQIITDLQCGNAISTTNVNQDISAVQREVWLKVVGCLSEAAARVNGGESNLIFLIDDNMFYRSMRYNLYQLARKYSTGFCQIGFECSTDIAIERNAKRKNGIPEETIVTMATRLEQPDASKAPWEVNSILIDADEEVNHGILAPVWMMLQSSFLTPVPPLIEEDEEAKEQSRAECAASLLHQADQVLRKCISETLATSKGNLTSTERKDLASELNQGKAAILDELRRGSLSPPDLPHENRSRETFAHFFKECLNSKLVK
ncbi:L-seryl-tRNA(Sec) kinase [Strongylocentrotus purpuratus]|uniref:L-seryl-tRNA(Sec) kinase n=1 Tax=Strongylocentrotus purpuratus TaxID=7668 RepID=A0A7M7GEL6_STRPU|nr:L-seryl-tRNA(Sec) kinase [Strongylocentrotus purpuratus]